MLRRVLLALLCVLLIGGLVLCGPGHDALHADSHGADAAGCDACHLAGVEAPAGFVLDGPVFELRHTVLDAVASPRTHDVPFTGSPRGPPRAGIAAA